MLPLQFLLSWSLGFLKRKSTKLGQLCNHNHLQWCEYAGTPITSYSDQMEIYYTGPESVEFNLVIWYIWIINQVYRFCFDYITSWADLRRVMLKHVDPLTDFWLGLRTYLEPWKQHSQLHAKLYLCGEDLYRKQMIFLTRFFIYKVFFAKPPSIFPERHELSYNRWSLHCCF